MRNTTLRAWLGVALAGVIAVPLLTDGATGAAGDVNTEIRLSVFRDGAGAFDAAPDNGPLPSPSSVYGGTGSTFVYADSIIDDQITAPVSWDAGEDASASNGVVRTFDQITYRIDWNVNEQNNQQVDVATDNVIIRATLPDDPSTSWADINWIGGSDLPPTCLTTTTPPSAITAVAGGSELLCNLGRQRQGSNGSIYPLARLNGSQNGKTFSLNATIDSDDNTAPVTSNKVTIIASARPQWDWVNWDGACQVSAGPPPTFLDHGTCGQPAPMEIRDIVDQNPSSLTFGQNGRLYVHPLVLKPSTATGLGTEPLATPITVSFIHDFSRYPDGARMLDFTPVDKAVTLDLNEATLFDAAGNDGCRPLNMSVSGVPFGDTTNAFATAVRTTTLPGDWSCTPDSGNRQRINVTVSNIDTANPSTKDSVGANNSARITAAGQLVVWVPEGSGTNTVFVADPGGTANMSLSNFATGSPTRTGGLYSYIGNAVTITESAATFKPGPPANVRLNTPPALSTLNVTPVTTGMVGVSGVPNLPSAETDLNNDAYFSYDLTPQGTYSNLIRYGTNDDRQYDEFGMRRRQLNAVLPGSASPYDGRGVVAPGERIRLVGEVYQAGASSLLNQPGQCITIDTTNQYVTDLPVGRLSTYPEGLNIGPTAPGNINPAIDFYVANGYDAATHLLDSWGNEMTGLVPGTDYVIEYAKVADVPSLAAGERLVGHYCGDAGSGRASAWFDWNPAAGVDPGSEPALATGDIAWSNDINNFLGPVINGVQTYTLNKIRWKMVTPIADKIMQIRIGIMIKPQTPVGIARDDGSTSSSVNCSNTGLAECDPNFHATLTDPYLSSQWSTGSTAGSYPLDFNRWLGGSTGSVTVQNSPYQNGSKGTGPSEAGGPPECYTSDPTATYTGAGGATSPFGPATPAIAYTDVVRAVDPMLENETSTGSWMLSARCTRNHLDRGNIQLAKPTIAKRVVNQRPRYNVGDQVTWEIQVAIYGANGDTANNVVLTDRLLANHKLISATSALEVTPVLDGPTTAGAAGDFTFSYGNRTVPFSDTITVVTEITGGTPNGIVRNGARLDTANRGSTALVYATINLVGPYDELVTTKQVATMLGDCVRHPELTTPFAGWADKCEIGAAAGPYSFGLELANTGLSALSNVRVIDVLPWNGDSIEAQTSAVGTTPDGPFGDGRQPASDFNGTLTYTSSTVTRRSGTAVTGVTTLVTMDNPANVNRDPDAVSNGGTVGSAPATVTTWCAGVGGVAVAGPGGGVPGTGTCPATAGEVTAVTWVIASIPTSEVFRVNVVMTPANNSGTVGTTAAGDQCSWYTNSFGARTNSISLPVRSNDVTVMAACADVSLEKTYTSATTLTSTSNDPGFVRTLDDPFTMKLTVTNDGPDDLTNVKVADILPAGMELIDSAPVATTAAAPIYEWTIPGPIAPAASEVITVLVKVTAKPAVLTNFAEVTGMDQADLDSSTRDGDDPATTDDEHEFPSVDNLPNEDDESSAAIALLGDYAWYDDNGNGVQDIEELPVEGMTVNLYASNGTTLLATTTTASDGSYLFVLPQGLTNGIVEFVKPAGYSFTAKDSLATGSSDALDSDVDKTTGRAAPVTVNVGEENLTVDAGIHENLSLSGAVWQDALDNGVFDLDDIVLEDVTITLTGTDNAGNPVSLQTTTDEDGNYAFVDLAPGTYTVTETQPANLLDASVLPPAGSKGGTVSANAHTTITLAAGDEAVDYDFIEIVGVSIAGNVYLDVDNSGTRNTGDLPIEGVRIGLSCTDDLGQTVSLTTTTLADGSYLFTGLRPGTCTVSETQPTAYADGADNLGTGPDEPGVTGPDVHREIVLGAGDAGINYDFGEIAFASIAGHVYADLDNSKTRNERDTPIAGVTVTLTGTDDRGNAVSLVTETQADGSYLFSGLRPGTYRVNETQPTAYVDNADNLGSGAQANGTTSNDEHSAVVLTAGQAGVNYDFGELKPAEIAGRVWFDRDNDGKFDPSKDLGLAGVTITLTGTDDLGNRVTLTVTTATDGSYLFTGLRPGIYTITETQPAEYRDGKIVPPGSLGGASGTTTHTTISLAPGQAGTAYDFPEFRAAGALPATGNSSLRQPLQLGAIGVALGLGLLLVARRRRAVRA
jgi:uncharacterized repeat protein (TIGR01451 family)